MESTQSVLGKRFYLFYLSIAAIICTLFFYEYGNSNHSIIIPFLKNNINDEIYSLDYLMPQKRYYLTFFWDSVAFLVKESGLSIRLLFFLGYLISTFFSLLGIYLLAVLLFGNAKAGFLALFIQTFGFIHNPGLGGEYLMDHIFKESMAALPLLIFAWYYYFKDKFISSFILQGIAFLIHPLTTIYTTSLILLCLVFRYRSIPLKQVLLAIFLFLLVVAPLFIRKYLNSPPDTSFFADPAWLDLLKIRSSHHIFPSTWSVWLFVKAAILLLIFLYSIKEKPLKQQYHRTIIISVCTILFLWLAGTIFTELVPLTPAIQLQFFRSYAFLALFVIMYFSNRFVIEMESEGPWYKKVLLVILLFALVSSPPEFERDKLIFVGFAVIVLAYDIIFRRTINTSMFVSAILLITGSFYLYTSLKHNSWMRYKDDPKWIEVQLWAKNESAFQDIFIVPPNKEGFRIHSERSIYGDWKDGTQMFFNPQFGFKWIKRMEKLGFSDNSNSQAELKKSYQNLTVEQLKSISDNIKAAETIGYEQKHFVVMPANSELKFPEAYRNKKYIVYEII